MVCVKVTASLEDGFEVFCPRCGLYHADPGDRRQDGSLRSLMFIGVIGGREGTEDD